jgi:hypothetical protein
MSFTAFALVVAAACLHALWNLAAKRVSGNIGVLWLGLWMSGLALAPFALFSASKSFDPTGLPYIITTGLIHAVYIILLAAGEGVRKLYNYCLVSDSFSSQATDGYHGPVLIFGDADGEAS